MHMAREPVGWPQLMHQLLRPRAPFHTLEDIRKFIDHSHILVQEQVSV